ncbi:MAG: hypothetical protein ACLP5H_15450 [Desulfomonilaceae bacterium]
MHRHRVWLLVPVLCLAIAAPANAWEFLMDGAFTWEYDYRSQGGASGFFGPYDQDAGSGIPGAGAGFFAPINGWLGEHAGPVNGGFVSGSDASWQVMYMSTNMEVRMNPAVRVRGNYYIGEWSPTQAADFSPDIDNGVGNLVASQSLNNRWTGIQRSFSPGYWNTLWLSAQLPWGEVTLGKRKSTFGLGMYFNGEENRSSESLAFAVPYGPFRFVISIYPSRRGNINNNYSLLGDSLASGTPPGNTASYYNQDFDKNNTKWWDATIPAITYRNGPLDVGFLMNPTRWNLGGESIINSPGNRATGKYIERTEAYGAAYMKYNNGRFFFNAELDWDHQVNRTRKKVAGGGSAVNTTNVFKQNVYYTDTYMENWRAVAEGGFLCGPAKLSLITAWAAGPDRRAGVQIDRNGLIITAGRVPTNNIRQPNSFANTGLFRPYSLLMVYDYGLGTHINGDTGNGSVEDAMVYGGRLDYAVAANLNTYLSFFWADRVSQSGYGWGFILPVMPAAQTVTDVAAAKNNVISAGNVTIFHNLKNEGPSIPDTNLGWEIGAGFDWKLLENLTVNFSSAAWQPGPWFAWACVDKSIVNWAGATGNTKFIGPVGDNNPAHWGVNPNKTIDPIYGIELKVTGDF